MKPRRCYCCKDILTSDTPDGAFCLACWSTRGCTNAPANSPCARPVVKHSLTTEATCKDLLQLAGPEAVWLKRMTRQLAGDGATGIIIRNHLRTIIDILRMVDTSTDKESLTVGKDQRR
jgi:hypothetical protein